MAAMGKALEASGTPKHFPSDVEALETDNNTTITFVKMLATRTQADIASAETGSEQHT